MLNSNTKASSFLALSIFFGLGLLGYFLVDAVNVYKQYDRTVIVKGLSQKQYDADVVLWPIKFTVPAKELDSLNKKIDSYTKEVKNFLIENSINEDEITIQAPNIVDKLANNYAANKNFQYRYNATRTINVYSKNVELIRKAISKLSELSKKGIILKVNDYDTRVEYIFTKLNEIKPSMIEESTKNARASALKFAKDSSSKLGKIKKARQGQFSIYNRDKNTPYIKTVRVVSTVEYYLND